MAAATAMLAIGLIGMGVSAIGKVKQGNAAKAAGDSEAELQEFNAHIADLQAQDAIARGHEDESRFNAGVRTLIGTQRAGFSGSGVVVDRGSAADVQRDSATLGALDAAKIRRNAEREAWGFEVEAADRRMGATVARKSGRSARNAAYTGAAAGVLTDTTSLLAARNGWGQGRGDT
jgi:hypothetical protein